MMSLMRKMIHNNVYKFILWAFLFMMAIGSGLAFIEVDQHKDWVIKVYDSSLSKRKFHIMLQAAKKQQEYFRQKGVMFAQKNVEKETVEGAVGTLLSEHVMSAIYLTVPKALVEQTIQKELGNLPGYFFHPNGELNHEVFARQIAPQTIDDFVENLQEEKRSKLFYSIIDLGTYTPDFELALQYNVDFANKSYSLMTFPLQKYINQSKENAPTDEVLAKFYKKSKNSEQFKTQEKRAGVVWQFKQQDFVIAVSQSDVKANYDKNKQKYLVSPAQMQVRTLFIKAESGKEAEARQKIEGLKEQADKDQDNFVGLIKKFSEDKESAAKGGLSEMFQQDDAKLNKLMVKMAFESLSKDGQVSTPIKVDGGYELIQRVKRVPANYKNLKDVETDIKKELSATRFKQRFQQDSTRVINQARYSPEALEKFIDRYKGSKKEISLAARKGSGAETNQLFKTEEHKYTVFFDKDTGFILQCTEVEKSTVPALEDVKAKVVVNYHEQEGKKQLEENMAKALKEAQGGNFEEIAKKYGATIQKATFEYKNGKVDQSQILKEQAIQAKMKVLHSQGAVAEVMLAADGMLLRLDSMDDRDNKVFEAEKKKLSKMMFYTKKYQTKDGFVASLYRNAKLNGKIELKEDVSQFIKES